MTGSLDPTCRRIVIYDVKVHQGVNGMLSFFFWPPWPLWTRKNRGFLLILTLPLCLKKKKKKKLDTNSSALLTVTSFIWPVYFSRKDKGRRSARVCTANSCGWAAGWGIWEVLILKLTVPLCYEHRSERSVL